MGECLILGDSIAVGVRQHSRPACTALAVSGITAAGWAAKYPVQSLDAETVVISLGSNGIATRADLTAVRSRIREGRVYWIMPAIKPLSRAAVRDVARAYGDWVIEIGRTSDGVHPADYRSLAERAGVR